MLERSDFCLNHIANRLEEQSDFCLNHIVNRLEEQTDFCLNHIEELICMVVVSK